MQKNNSNFMQENLTNKARAFAIEAHGEQKYGKFPYSVHLDEVASIAKPYGTNAEVVAYLHDVIEDTNITAKEVEDIFGSLVARCVQILTDEPGETRKIRKTATYKKMATVSGDENLALIVKAADRLANMRACVRGNDEEFLSMYKTENVVFKKAAFRENLCDDIWAEIDAI